jgi:hypothetical protein
MLDNRELVAKRIKKQLERMAKDGTAPHVVAAQEK